MKRIVLLAALLLSACSPKPDPVSPAATTDCEGACKQLDSLGCEEAKPSPEQGVPCVKWCGDYHADDYMPPWSECVSKATSVEAVRACGLKCE
jgi:hypothetical protein